MPLWVDRERALYGTWYEFFPRSEGARRRPGDRRAWSAAPSAPPTERLPAVGRRWASTSSTCRRSTRSARPTARARNNTLTPGPDDVGLAVGHRRRRRAGTTRSTPTSAPIEDFDAFVARAARARPRGRARPRPAGRARPPVGDGAPGVVHRRAPTARSPTPRTRRRSTRTSTRSTSTTTPRASTPRCCGSSGTGWTTACGSSGSTTRTPSRSNFWALADGRGPQDRPGRASSWPRRSPGRR